MTKHPTLQSFLQTLEKDNLSLAEWARRKGLNLQAVYTVCNGRALGKRGETRRVMQAMGLTTPPMHTSLRLSAPSRAAEATA